MQFRAGAFYIVLFLVLSAGAYAVIATAEAPEATVDEADADYVLSEEDEFEVDGELFIVAEVGEDSGMLEQIEEDVTLEQSWDDGETVMLEEDAEYDLRIDQPEEDDAEEDDDGQPTSFTLIEVYDDDDFETVERDDGVFVVVDDDGSEELIPIEEFDEIDTQTYEAGDSISYFDEDEESQIDGEVSDITAETVTVEYIGDEITETDLEQGVTVTLNGEEFVAYFPGGDEVYLSSNIEDYEQQVAEVEYHHERIGGFWWVIGLSMISAIFIAGLAFMPVRG